MLGQNLKKEKIHVCVCVHLETPRNSNNPAREKTTVEPFISFEHFVLPTNTSALLNKYKRPAKKADK